MNKISTTHPPCCMSAGEIIRGRHSWYGGLAVPMGTPKVYGYLPGYFLANTRDVLFARTVNPSLSLPRLGRVPAATACISKQAYLMPPSRPRVRDCAISNNNTSSNPTTNTAASSSAIASNLNGHDASDEHHHAAASITVLCNEVAVSV